MRPRTILLNGAGWKARKTPAAGIVFLLDSLYGTYRELKQVLALD
jgi:hypothetical protein